MNQEFDWIGNATRFNLGGGVHIQFVDYRKHWQVVDIRNETLLTNDKKPYWIPIPRDMDLHHAAYRMAFDTKESALEAVRRWRDN